MNTFSIRSTSLKIFKCTNTPVQLFICESISARFSRRCPYYSRCLFSLTWTCLNCSSGALLHTGKCYPHTSVCMIRVIGWWDRVCYPHSLRTRPLLLFHTCDHLRDSSLQSYFWPVNQTSFDPTWLLGCSIVVWWTISKPQTNPVSPFHLYSATRVIGVKVLKKIDTI